MKKGYFFLLIASLSYASMGVLVKAISIDTGPYLQTFLRLSVSVLLTALLVVVRKKPFLLKNKADYVLMLFMGVVGYGLQIILFTLAIYHTTIGNTLFLMSGYPIVTALLAYFFLKEQITKRLIISFFLLCIALFLIFQPGGLGTSLIGNLYALGVCLTFSLYVICSRIMSKRGNAAETMTLWSVGLAVVTSGIAAGTFEQITVSLSATTIFFLILFGILNATAFNFVNKGFATVSAGVGTMILMSEPIIGSFLGFVFFREIPTLLFVGGAVLLLVSVVVATFKLKQ
jgi:drug/metabolite transporter (DMT)-like permease